MSAARRLLSGTLGPGFSGRMNPGLLTRQYCVAVEKKQQVFYNQRVQDLMRGLTNYDVQKIYRPRKEGKKTERSTYQFVTTEELEQMQKDFERKAVSKLQMPPVMDERESRCQVLEQDPLLTGFDNSKLVFTDITYGVPDRERIIVVRDVDGTLRTAEWDEHDRINYTYFPKKEQRHYVPPMFEPENLKEILRPEKYEFILDKNCLQFEPDHPIYIRTAAAVYDHANETSNFRALESTRHYGPMIFYLCWNRRIDDFIVHLILDKKLEQAASTIELFQLITKDDSFALMGTPKTTVTSYAKSPASTRSQKILMALDKMFKPQLA